MEITQTLFNELRLHCTPQLLSYVRNVKVVDNANNQWDITSLVDANDHLYEMLKVFYAFEKLGGTLIFKGEIEVFPTILRHLDNTKFLEIPMYWVNNEINGDSPIFDIGELEIPPVLPRYSSRPNEDGKYVVEELIRGRYVAIPNEIYLTAKDAREKAEQLNRGT